MASKRRLRRKSCERKRRYATQDEAVAALRSVGRAGKLHGQVLPYRCNFCGGFHWGHPPRNIRRAAAAALRA